MPCRPAPARASAGRGPRRVPAMAQAPRTRPARRTAAGWTVAAGSTAFAGARAWPRPRPRRRRCVGDADSVRTGVSWGPSTDAEATPSTAGIGSDGTRSVRGGRSLRLRRELGCRGRRTGEAFAWHHLARSRAPPRVREAVPARVTGSARTPAAACRDGCAGHGVSVGSSREPGERRRVERRRRRMGITVRQAGGAVGAVRGIVTRPLARRRRSSRPLRHGERLTRRRRAAPGVPG